MSAPVMFLALLASADTVPATSPSALPAASRKVELFAVYNLDLTSGTGRIERLDKLSLTATGETGGLGWRGGRFKVNVLASSGGRPNEGGGTLQGLDNIEVPDRGVRLFEAWFEQDLGGGSLRVGAYDLNSEFYTTSASALFVGPSYGIGPELSATGSRGPSIFPFTGLAARGDVRIGASGIVRAAVINAAAGTLGDRGGIDTSFREGVLGIVEGGFERGAAKLAIGGWAYSKRHEVHGASSPSDLGRTRGAYLLAQAPLAESWSGFARAGVAGGGTTAFRASVQGGLEKRPFLAIRPDSAAAFGVHHARLSPGERELARAAGEEPGAETGFELTISDHLFGPVSLQPSVQWIHNPGGRRDADPLLFGALRLTLELR
ncbi:carbohydrate porin [Sphingomonas swuensis]|uniref:Carbohydrate porin n=1 Tax=Sphingomonas swuensis TaxID=977800 RepID=A0ABP7SD88_9SPHN